MSLWLQAATEALHEGDYENFRERILPSAPFKVPDCVFKEIEFGERKCPDNKKGRLFPIRLLWVFEANEQRLFGLPALGRSAYHPEKLYDLWVQVNTDPDYRKQLEADGFIFDLNEKAVELSAGWVYIGDRFVEDFLEVEAFLGVELLFPVPDSNEKHPAFQDFKKQHPKKKNLVKKADQKVHLANDLFKNGL